LPTIVCMSIAPTSTQAAMPAGNSNAGDSRLKIKVLISTATTRATNNGSILGFKL